jgi:hypothetical protein
MLVVCYFLTDCVNRANMLDFMLTEANRCPLFQGHLLDLLDIPNTTCFLLTCMLTRC